MMNDPYEFPTAIEDDGEGKPMRWTITIVALSTLGLAVFNPGAITAWVADLAPTPLTLRLADAADAWEGAINRVGLGAPHAGMHAAWKAAERTDWTGRSSAQLAADTDSPKP